MTSKRIRHHRLAKFATVFVSILVGLALSEVGLRLVESSRLGDRKVTLVPDPLLGIRVPPFASGHDSNGFRNDNVPIQADIVALGDSQTWGVNVQRADAWPQQLAKLSGRRVYNMGVGAYGPVQYWALTDKALSFSPRVIIVALYQGNDFYDAYHVAYTNENYRDLRAADAPPELKEDVTERASQTYWDEEKEFHNNFGRSSLSGWSLWLREHSAIGRLLNRIGWWPGAADVDYLIDREWAHAHPDHGANYDQGNIRTVFTTAYRLTTLDSNDPRIREGLRITKEMLVRIQQKAAAVGARTLVLVVPTKELVYADLMKRENLDNGAYALLIAKEMHDRDEMLSFCVNEKIQCADALPPLRAAIERGEQIYPASTESHPNAHGYTLLAAVANKAIQELSW